MLHICKIKVILANYSYSYTHYILKFVKFISPLWQQHKHTHTV